MDKDLKDMGKRFGVKQEAENARSILKNTVINIVQYIKHLNIESILQIKRLIPYILKINWVHLRQKIYLKEQCQMHLRK